MEIFSKTKKHRVDRILAFTESLPIGDRFFLKVALAIFVVSFLWLIISINAATLVDIPDRGGTLSEGIVGTPRFLNPVLAVTTADQDLTALVYAGLMTLSPHGDLVPDIAESVDVSEDGLVYTVRFKEHVTFHDNTPLTTDDVIFTVTRVQDPLTKSPLRASWEGVTIERQDDHEMRFILTEAYAPFIENLTLGILPKHIWEHASSEELPFSQYNSEPIGAGPYKISEILRNSSGMPEYYELVPHREYFKSPPKIETIGLHFYPTEERLVEALKQGTVTSAGGLSEPSIEALTGAKTPFTVVRAPLPRTFSLFFNQNELPLFRDNAVRKALETVVDRRTIVAEALGGYGEPISSPIPPGFKIDVEEPDAADSIAALGQAREILRQGGWRINDETSTWEKVTSDGTLILSFSITTANTPVFEETAQLLKVRFEELGVPVTIKQFEQSDLIQTVIRPRQYETLLFGTVVGRELDFFSFWHSSQRNDPGLNVALYTNIAADALLSSARAKQNFDERKTLYQKFSEEIARDIPAIFLYVPTYTYVIPKNVHNVSLSGIARGSERFGAINEWYMEKDAVWPFSTLINSN